MTSALGRPQGLDLPSNQEVNPKLPLGHATPGAAQAALCPVPAPLTFSGDRREQGTLALHSREGAVRMILDVRSIYGVPGVCLTFWAQGTQQ